MVQADGDSIVEHIADLEQELFELIDEEIRASHDWCKDLVLELTQRFENLARRHLSIVKNKLQRVKQTS